MTLTLTISRILALPLNLTLTLTLTSTYGMYRPTSGNHFVIYFVYHGPTNLPYPIVFGAPLTLGDIFFGEFNGLVYVKSFQHSKLANSDQVLTF